MNKRSVRRQMPAAPTADEIINNMDALNSELPEDVIAEVPEDLGEIEDLDKQLEILNAKLAAKEAEAAEENEATEDEEPADGQQALEARILKTFKEHKNTPSEEQIAAWKKRFGNDGVYVIALSENDMYVFTYLTRGALKKITEVAQKQAQLDEGKNPDDYLMEQVVRQCVLWPKLSLEFFYNSRSGTIPTLYEVIMLHSYHINAQQALMLTARL